MQKNNNNIVNLSFIIFMLLLLTACVSGNTKSSGLAVSDMDKRQDEITIAIEQSKSITNSIYQSALQRNSSYRGRVELEMIVLPNGFVEDVSVISSDIEDDIFLNELVVYFKGLKFKEGKTGNIVTTIPLDFDQGT